MYKTFVPDELIEKWLPVIEGKQKWEKVVEGMPKVSERHYGVMAQCLENTVLESTLAANAAGTSGSQYSPILVPMIRRVMPSLIGMDIFGVQPLTGPTGLVFALHAVYQNDSVTNVSRSNSFIVTVATTTDGGSNVATVGGSISFTNDDSVADPVEVVKGTILHIEGNNILVKDLGTGTGSYTDLSLTSAAANAGAMFAATCTQSQTIGTSALYANEALFDVIFSNYTGSYTTATGEALSTTMKEIGFELDSQTTTAKTRKLKAKWTNEMEQDLKAVHNMNAESLLSGIASDEIVMEMNREFIGLVGTQATAGGTTTWAYTTADGRWEAEKAVNLVGAINRARRDIAVATKRGQGNFIITSPDVLSLLELSGKLSSEGTDPVNQSFAGVLKGSGVKVYVDIYQSNNDILVGYKGSSEVDAGIFYSPYVPLQISKGMGEEDGQPRTFFSTRYGVANNPNGASNYYRRINVTGTLGGPAS